MWDYFKKHNPAADLLNMMAWSIFITTIPKEQADFKRIGLSSLMAQLQFPEESYGIYCSQHGQPGYRQPDQQIFKFPRPPSPEREGGGLC